MEYTGIHLVFIVLQFVMGEYLYSQFYAEMY